MSSLYEKPLDRSQARLVMSFLSQCRGLRVLRETEEAHPYDFEVADRGLEACVEVKCRDKFYGRFMVDLKKLEELMRLAEEQGRRAMLVVMWKDIKQIGIWCPLTPLDILETGMGGREDRGDALDQDVVAYLDSNRAERYSFF